MDKQQLIEHIKQKRSFLCVGLDPDLKKLPECVLRSKNAVFDFNKAIIDATAEYSVAFKPNLAFYEVLGLEGEEAFRQTCRYIKEVYPDHLIIADAKRGDIGNTARMYAASFFEYLNIDAVTVAPYMGEDSVKPFLEYEDKWTILLALTSNPGSFDFQTLKDADGIPLWENVLNKSKQWGGAHNMMYVVGATQGRMFEKVRKIVPDNFLLVPGVGAQGGSLEDVCRYGMTSECGLLVNSSRGILYASGANDFAEEAALEAKKLRDQMDNELQKHDL